MPRDKRPMEPNDPGVDGGFKRLETRLRRLLFGSSGDELEAFLRPIQIMALIFFSGLLIFLIVCLVVILLS